LHLETIDREKKKELVGGDKNRRKQPGDWVIEKPSPFFQKTTEEKKNMKEKRNSRGGKTGQEKKTR